MITYGQYTMFHLPRLFGPLPQRFWEYSHKSGIVLVGVLPNLLKCYTRIKIDRIYKFDILLPQNIDRFSGSSPRVLIVTLPDKSPGVIPLDSRTRLDEIYNSQKMIMRTVIMLDEDNSEAQKDQ